MGKFNRGGFGGDRGGCGNFGGRRGNDRPEMHRATCDECGKSCEVPFRPSGDKPVFCSDCFENKRDGGNDRGGDRGNRIFEKRDNQSRFGDRRPSTNVSQTVNYKKELIQINETLNKILRILSPVIKEETTSRHEKIPKKEVDTVAFKETLQTVVGEKKIEKKTKKVVSKKTLAPKKKAVNKKKITHKIPQ